MKQLILLLFLCLSAKKSYTQETAIKYTPAVKDSLVNRYYKNGMGQFALNTIKYQLYADTVLHFFPNNPEIWHQRAIPLFKSGKYELGMQNLNKALEMNRKEYIAYRGFINCIFLKQHRAALQDFKEAIAEKGDFITMDHPCSYYMGLSYLQLNNLDSAKFYLAKALDFERLTKSEGFLSTTNWFYLAVIEYEQTHWEAAISLFDKTLELYSSFPEAKYYKALCLNELGKKAQAKILLREAEAEYHSEYLFPEYNAVYEKYPYSITKRSITGTLEFWEKEE